MYYVMIVASALLFSLQFFFNDGYKRECGSSLASALKFSLYTSIVGLLFLLVINKFNFAFSLFSLVVALVYSAICVVFSYCSVKAFETANLSVYSVFSMVGGMILPFVYGLVCGEEFKLLRVVCCLFIAAAIILTADRSGKNKGGFKYYIAVFVLNGLVGVVSKFHQSNIAVTDSASFMMLTKICTALIALAALLCFKKKNFRASKKAMVFCGVHAAVNSLGNLLLLVALLHLPASVQYPMVTGGTMLFAFLISLCRGENITKRDVLGVILAIAATVIIIL